MNAQTEQQFIQWMADHLQNKALMDSSESLEYAKELYYPFLEDNNTYFDDEEYSWCREDAENLVDIDMSYWDC